jgi:hypothetical protein
MINILSRKFDRHFIYRLTIIIIAILIFSQSLGFQIFLVKSIDSQVDVLVGVDVAYADLSAIKTRIDEVSSYTNVFVIGSTGITYNEERLDEICQYLYERDMFFIIYWESGFPEEWFEYAKDRWNDLFLGFYFLDEVGGRQLDRIHMPVREADSYADAGNKFVNSLNNILDPGNYYSSNSSVFTSDYALYWFDYQAGYDVVFAEFGWNYSRQINVALNRGAATVRDRDWGIIITWTFNNPPYIESGEQLYQDLIFAYDNGAKYILVFDSNEDYTGGILQEEHFDALKQFWEYVKNNPRGSDSEKHVAFVLPDGYGYGFRGPDDKIWGLWEADWLSLEVSYHIGSLLDQYGNRLDIIYDDSRFNFREYYSEIIFWNGTNYDPPKVEPPENDMLPVFVEDVSDGDTFQTTEGYKIRLADIDAPELGGIGYSDSREFLELLIEHKIVILDIDEKIGSDLYGRYDCVVYLPYNSTHYINVNQASVEGGYSIIHNYSNEFDPTVWSLYSPINSIPEFQLFLIFPLFLMVTLFVIILKSQI